MKRRIWEIISLRKELEKEIECYDIIYAAVKELKASSDEGNQRRNTVLDFIKFKLSIAAEDMSTLNNFIENTEVELPDGIKRIYERLGLLKKERCL